METAANEERVLRLGADRFIDYKKEDYAKVLSNVDYVLDTLGDRELEKEFSILKDGGSLVSLRGMPNGEFAARAGLPAIKRLLLKVVGRKYDKMAAKKNQKYAFVFVHEDGPGLEKINGLFSEQHLKASVDEVFSLDDVNKALQKVVAGRSKGKTVIRIAQ
jgi:NADPH:quinone reductase-like Zn-dependent oxidoreductase